jgi:hypothetical protein
VPFIPQFQDLALLGGEPAPDLLQEVARGHLTARAGAGSGDLFVVPAAGGDVAAATSLGSLPARL